MSTTGKYEAQSFDEMTESMNTAREKDLSSSRGRKKIYKQESGEYKKAEMSSIVSCEVKRLAEIATKEKVSLADVEEVKRRTIIYLRACEETGTPPSCIGLAHSLGYSDRALRDHRNNQPNSETAQWLEMFNEMCSDVLNQSALNNNVNPLYAMFINKAKYDYVDRKELILTPNNTSNTEDDYSAEDIKKRYLPYAHKEIIEGGADDGTDLL